MALALSAGIDRLAGGRCWADYGAGRAVLQPVDNPASNRDVIATIPYMRWTAAKLSTACAGHDLAGIPPAALSLNEEAIG